MGPVSVFDAKNKLSALLDEVERGAEVTITRRGMAIAKLVPTQAAGRAQAAVTRLHALRQGIAARGQTFSWDELKSYRDDARR